MPIDQASSSASNSGLVSDAQGKATAVAGEAQEQAQRAAAQVHGKLREQIDERSAHASALLSEQASDLRSVGESLRQQDKEGPAKAADQLAQYAEKVGGYLHQRDSQALLSDAEHFGRRQPWAVAAGGLALGFAASRFLKASSRQRYRSALTVSRPNGVYATPSPPPGNGTSDWSQPGTSGLGSGAVV